MGIRMLEGLPLRAFCLELLSKGDFCVIDYTEGCDIVRKYDASVDDAVHGISLNDVVDIDLRKDFPKGGQVQLGGMINVLSRGIVVLRVKGKNLPHNTPVYVTKKGNISSKKKKGRPLVGHTCSSQDKEGFVQVRLSL